MKKIFTLLSVLFYMMPGLSAQVTVSFKPGPVIGEDAYIYMLTNNCVPNNQNTTVANINYGNSPTIKIMAWTWAAHGCRDGSLRTLLRFTELSTLPPTATINSATLVLRTASTGMDQGNSIYPGSPHASRPNPGWLKRVNPGAADNWDEQTVTWNTAPSTDPNPANWVTIPVSNCHLNCTLSLDVTDIVKDIFDDMQNNVTNANNGFLLQLQDEVYYRSQSWASSDYADSAYWPELIINYTGCLDSLDLKAQPNPICEGEDVQLSSRQVPGATYLWKGPDGFTSNSPNPLLTNLGAIGTGNYVLEVSDYGNDCVTLDTIGIQVNRHPEVDLGPDTIVCAGDIISLYPKHNYTNASYIWNTNDATAFVNVRNPGKYWVTVTENGCEGSDTVHVAYDTVKVNLGPDTTICENGEIVLSSSTTYSNASYLWNTGDTTSSLRINEEGTYTLHVSEKACTGSDTVYVEKIKVNVDLGADTVICSGEAYTLKSSFAETYNNPSYQWSNGASGPSITTQETGDYKLVVEDRGCVGSDSVSLIFPPTYDISLGNDTVLCNKEAIVLNPKAPITDLNYLWNTGARESVLQVNTSGYYWLQATDQYGCAQSDSIQVTYVHLAQNLGDDALLCIEDPIDIQLQAHVPPGAIALWSTGESTATIDAKESGTYWVKVSYPPCEGSDTININTQICDCQILIPNAFTPNGDQLNDIFRPTMDLDCPLSEYSLKVFNRWGQLIFHGIKPEDGWDGTVSGKAADLGTYLYMIKYKIKYNNEIKFFKGDITLIR